MPHSGDAVFSASHNMNPIRSSGQARNHPVIVKPLYIFPRINVPHSHARLGRANDVLVILSQSKTAWSVLGHLERVKAIKIGAIPHVNKRVFARGDNEFVVTRDCNLIHSLLVPAKISFQWSTSWDETGRLGNKDRRLLCMAPAITLCDEAVNSWKLHSEGEESSQELSSQAVYIMLNVTWCQDKSVTYQPNIEWLKQATTST